MYTYDFIVWIFATIITAILFTIVAYWIRKAKLWIRILIFAAEILFVMLIAYLFVVVLSEMLPYFLALQPLLIADLLISTIEFIVFLITLKTKSKTKSKIKKFFKKYAACFVCAIGLFLLLEGFYNMQYTVKTDYNIKSEKIHNNYNIVFISDVHYGSSKNADAIKEAVDKINALDVDCLIVGGDTVDDFTTTEKREECLDILSKINTKKGKFIINGNHEYIASTSHYVPEEDRFTKEEFLDSCRSHGFNVINEDAIPIGDDLIIAGRDNWQKENRTNGDLLKTKFDSNKFVVCADHQPEGWKEDLSLGIDLTLSGHYHGGQVWPLSILSTLSGNYTYGLFEKDKQKLIVTSGLAGWQLPCRSDHDSEFVVINLSNEN